MYGICALASERGIGCWTTNLFYNNNVYCFSCASSDRRLRFLLKSQQYLTSTPPRPEEHYRETFSKSRQLFRTYDSNHGSPIPCNVHLVMTTLMLCTIVQLSCDSLICNGKNNLRGYCMYNSVMTSMWTTHIPYFV